MFKDYSVNPLPVNGNAVQSTDNPLAFSPCVGENPSEGQTRITCPHVLVSDVDTLHVSLWLEWDDFSFFDSLQEKKLIVQDSDLKFLPFNFWGISWNFYRTGNSNFPYHLSVGDIHLFLNRRDSAKPFPTAKVEIGSMSCWIPGAYDSFYKVIHFLQIHGASVKKEIVSRVDLACDSIGTNINKINIDNQDLWISRSRKFSVHFSNRKITGVTLGQGNIMLRIYDKVAELKQKMATSKQKFFAEIWGLEKYDDKPVTRIEFQLRREVLNNFQDGSGRKINSVKELMFSLRSLWEYCTSKWARQADRPVDRKNKNQSKISSSFFWISICKASFSGHHILKRCKKICTTNVDALQDQVRGCLMTITASMDYDVDDISGIIRSSCQIVADDLLKYFNEEYSKFSNKFLGKKNKALGWIY